MNVDGMRIVMIDVDIHTNMCRLEEQQAYDMSLATLILFSIS
jgi:hypothetical protein